MSRFVGEYATFKPYFYQMQQVLTEEYFSAPLWQIIIYRMLSLIVFILGFSLLMIKDAGSIIFLVPLIFLIAVSMFFYTRLKLIISNDSIRFVGWLKPHHIAWPDVTKVDMVRLGKYKTPVAIVYYSNRKLELNRGFYLQRKFNRILFLLQTKIDSALFTERYKENSSSDLS